MALRRSLYLFKISFRDREVLEELECL